MSLLWLWDRLRKKRVWAIGDVAIDMIDLDGCKLFKKDTVKRTLTEISIHRPDAIVITPELSNSESLLKTCEINHIPAIVVNGKTCAIHYSIGDKHFLDNDTNIKLRAWLNRVIV